MSEPVVFILVIAGVFFIAWLVISFLDLCENNDIVPVGPGFMLTFPKVSNVTSQQIAVKNYGSNFKYQRLSPVTNAIQV